MGLREHLGRRGNEARAWSAAAVGALGPWGVGAIALTWVAVTPRMVPTLSSDHGVFVSVAERLLAGDRLYADVWDNKDPLFYYLLAASRAVTPFGSALLEVAWMAVAACAVCVIGRRLGATVPVSLVAGLAMTPIVLTGTSYEPGLSHLPGTALALAAVGGALARRHVLTGALLGVLVFTKVVVFPVGAILVAIILIRSRAWRGALLASAGMAGAALGVLAVLVVRDEFRPYLDGLRRNVDYSQGSLVEYGTSPVVAHLELVLRSSGMPTVVAVLLVATLALSWPRSAAGASMAPAARRTVWLTTVAGLAAGLAVIAVSGLWFHHAQVLAVAAALAALMTAEGVAEIVPLRRAPAALGLVLAAALLSGPVNPVTWALAVKDAPHHLSALATPPPLTRSALDLGGPATYARVGPGDDGHAIGLHTWRLVCPRFHQYSFDSPEVLADVLDCIPTAEVVLVATDAAPGPDDGSNWAAFLRGVQNVLADGYECRVTEAGDVCRRSADVPRS